jgi:Raf kinase inhibitor-like YbhB/YbcL family protein
MAKPPTRRRVAVTLRSTAFQDGDPLPERCTREGGNVSPPLEWAHAPGGAIEFALLCEDLDAPRGAFVHWVVTGIPASCAAVNEGQLPSGAAPGRNDYGEIGWGGPQAPPGGGRHRCVFTLLALDRGLALPEGVSAPEVRLAARDHELGRATLGTLVGS